MFPRTRKKVLYNSEKIIKFKGKRTRNDDDDDVDEAEAKKEMRLEKLLTSKSRE